MTRLLLADDHTMVRESLRDSLLSELSGLEIVEASDYLQALSVGEVYGSVHLIVADWYMPGLSAAKGMRSLMSQYPGTPIMVMSGQATENDLNLAVELGVRGFIPKTLGIKSLVQAITRLVGGDSYFPPLVVEMVKGLYINEDFLDRSDRSLIDSLSGRQKEIMVHLAHGLSNKEIARELGISENTVKEHFSVIYRKLGSANRIKASQIARAYLAH